MLVNHVVLHSSLKERTSQDASTEDVKQLKETSEQAQSSPAVSVPFLSYSHLQLP